jgi:hypothetical protein
MGSFLCSFKRLLLRFKGYISFLSDYPLASTPYSIWSLS